MKQIIYTCDRCRQHYQPYKSKSGFMGIQMFKKTKNPSYNSDGGDPRRFLYEYGFKKYLCPSCMEEVESWCFEEKDDEAEYPEGPETPFFKPSDGEDVPFDNADEESLVEL